MQRLISICVLVLVAFAARAQTFPTTQQITSDLSGPFSATQAEPSLKFRGEISRRVEKLLVQQSRYLISTLHPWDHDDRALLLTNGGSVEAQIRPNAHTAYGLAVLYRAAPDDAFTDDFTRDMARDKALAILRFLLPTHGAGAVKLKDGKLWHNQWQSALWAYSAGQACWLMWDDLDPQMKWLAARMICDEADRFVDAKPPMQVISDTKAEENAWDSQIISLAYCMFPDHPHHARWRDAAIRWIINSFPTQADTKRNDLFDGKPLKDWLVGANLHDDYTLENHDRVHPDYMSCTTMCMFQKMLFEWAGEKPPEALDLNVEKLYASSKILTFPDGGYVYPNGQDWQLHRNADWFDYHCPLAVQYHDPQAARLMRTVLETAEKMAARNPNGPIVLPEETIFASTQHFILEGYARSYLLLRAQGEGPEPVSEEKLWKDLSGVHIFAAGKFAIQRTEKSIATFSWGRQVMGMVLPMQRDLLLAPDEHSLTGFLGNTIPTVRQVRIIDIPNTLAICGVVDRSEKPKPATTHPATQPTTTPLIPVKLEQRFAFIALPDGRTIYADTVVSNVPRSALNGTFDFGTLGILNDLHWVYHDGVRTIHYGDTQSTFRADNARTDRSIAISSRWFNIDDRLGIGVLTPGAQETYDPTPVHAAGRLEQRLILNNGTNQWGRDVLVFYPVQKSDETAACVSRCKLDPSDDAEHFVVTLDDGMKISVDLERFSVKMSD